MPATITHAYFSLDVYDKIDNKNKKINEKYLLRFKMFSQSTDSIMFYNIESIKKGKDIRNFQYYFHTNKSHDFFITLCKYIKDKKLFDNSEVISFLYGFICHYVLDSTIHPFVIYKSGIMNKSNPNSYKYNCKHNYMETFLDNKMIMDRWASKNKSYSTFRLDKFCFDTKDFSSELTDTIDFVFKKVFFIDNMSRIYLKSLRQMKSFLFRYRMDRLGLKRLGYRTIDLFTSPSTFKFDCLSYHYIPKNEEIYLNLEHKAWYNPIDKSIKSYDSFYDLYDKAVFKAVRIINEVCNYFEDKKVSLSNVFTNNSYLTGLNCELGDECKFFEF